MDEYDLFELTNLPFDPPEKAAKKVKAAIEKIEKELNGDLGTETQKLKRDEIINKRDFLGAKKSEIFTSDWKLNKLYEELAKDRTDSEIENLKATVKLLKLSGKSVITSGTVKTQRAKTRLSKENVESVYLSVGFTITEIDPFSAMPKFPTNAELIYNELAALRKSKDPNPNGADLTLATDMYAFVAYLQGEPENSAEYCSKTSAELAKILDGYAKQYTTRNDNLGKLCASLATNGKMYIFNSDDNRRAYEAYVLYKSSALTELFAAMKRVCKTDLKDSEFADVCIKQISEVFGDANTALSIYNHEAGLKDDPYIPEKAIFYVKCAHCQNLSEFVNVEEAQKSNKCTHCGKALYQQCKRCNKKILLSADRCPECGFVFASIAMFSKYITMAEEALRRGKYDEARQHLANAQSADPGEKTRTTELVGRIAAEEAKYEKPLNELRQLIAKKKFQAASDVLVRIISSFPRLNVATYETQINATLAKAQSLFEGAKKRSASERADTCWNILDICEDFKPAVEFLRTPPLMIKNLAITVDSQACRATINWSRSSERGVTYRIVRKESKDVPRNERDGDILTDGTTDTIYSDEKLSPGTWYSYAIFPKRMGVCFPAVAVSKTILILADITDVHYEQKDTTLRITWSAPKNCTGVTISRTHDGKEVVLTENAHGSFEDKGLQYCKTYSYTLRANYYGLPPSQGVGFVVTPMVKIDQFPISVKQVSGNKYHVTWGINHKDIDVRILVNRTTMRELKSDIGGGDIDLPVDGLHTVEVSAFSGGNWLTSQNSVPINTYTSCEIDRTLSQIREKSIVGMKDVIYSIELPIKIFGTIPKNAKAFWYVVRTKSLSSKQAPWADISEIASAPDAYKVNVDTYQRNGALLFTGTVKDEDAYYVTIFTVYDVNGKEIISAPHKQRFDRLLNVDVFWKVSKPLIGRFGNWKLSIEAKPNRPYMRQPKLILCSCSQDQHLLSHVDAKAEILMEIPELGFDSTRKIYKHDYEISSDISVRIVKNRKLFLFEADSVSNEKYTLRWTEGFSGKV